MKKDILQLNNGFCIWRICIFGLFIILGGLVNSCKLNLGTGSFIDNTTITDDVFLIPDKYNTGCNEKTDFKEFEKITTGSGKNEKTFLVAQGDTGPLYLIESINKDDSSKSRYIITSYSKNMDELPNQITIENYDFSAHGIVNYNTERYAEKKYITFRNCKFAGFANCGPYDENKLNYIFDHCTFGGGVNEVNIELNWCKIGGFSSDAMNPLKNFTVKNTFIYNLASAPDKNPQNKKTHIDGFQIYGRKDTVGGNINFDNVRFEIPSIYYDGNTPAVNACFMFQLEFGDVNNCTFKNLICNGGGKWFPLYMTKGKGEKKFSQENISLINIKVSNNFGTIFYSGSFDQEAHIENVDHFDKLYVSSIIKADDGTTHVICTNDSSHDKTLTVQTDQGDFTFDIPHCPSNWALCGEIDKKVNPEESLKDEKGRQYTKYVYDDLPFDVDCVIEQPVIVIACYDGDYKLY